MFVFVFMLNKSIGGLNNILSKSFWSQYILFTFNFVWLSLVYGTIGINNITS